MNNFFSYLRLLLLATSGMLLLCIIFRHESGISRRHAVRKNLLVSFHISIVSRWGSTYGIYNKEKPFYLFITGCLITAPIRYRIDFLRQRRESSAGTFPFHRSTGRPLVYVRGALQAHQELRPFFITLNSATHIVKINLKY